jgi:hypothetical protein
VSAHPGNPFSCRGHRAKNPRRPPVFGLEVPALKLPKNRAIFPLFQVILKKTEKRALRLVQSVLNPFIISKNSENSRRKNEQKRPKIVLFREFFRLPNAPIIRLTPLALLPQRPAGIEGMHTAWQRYGKGTGPSPKSFVIRYAGGQ